MTDIVEVMARAILVSGGHEVIASAENWPSTMERHRRLVAEQGNDYAASFGVVPDAIRTARAALAALWQPIDTAPKDGTEVLIWAESGCEIASWIEGCGWFNGDVTEEMFGPPTHWQPLPSPPSKAETT